MSSTYKEQDRGNQNNYQKYLEAMDAISIEKVASASAFFDPKKGNTIVDVGMASGASSAILARLFPQLNIIGVDINPKMVEIARSKYVMPNLSFCEDDGEKLLTFQDQKVNGFFNCSSIHHITSYNDYDANRALNTLERQAELLNDKGVIVVRDFVKPQNKEVILELSSIDKQNRPSDCELLLLFSKTARSLAPLGERGFPINELACKEPYKRKFSLFLSDATEFIRRKDYYENWDIELQEEYSYFSQEDFEDTFQNLGLRIIVSSPIYNQWIINNRYKNQFSLYDINGKEMAFPPTNYLIAGEKVQKGKRIHLVRYLPQSPQPFLQYSSYQNIVSGQIYDLVSRPNDVLDILPYYKDHEALTVLAKHAYPRPLSNLDNLNINLDNKRFGGYITECLTTAKVDKLKDVLDKRFGIKREMWRQISNALHYYTSPGGINEKVDSLFVELETLPQNTIMLSDGFSGFEESGFLNTYDAKQLLNTAQTGTLAEARLELNIYHLLSTHNIPLPKWLGEKIEPKEDKIGAISILSDLIAMHRQCFMKSEAKTNFLTTRRAVFSESGNKNSSCILEFVYPESFSNNTLITLPLCKMDDNIYVGLEIRDLPVPQLYAGNSVLITVPACRLPKYVNDLFELKSFMDDLHINDSRIIKYFKLGEKYFPSIGVTPEQVYPYVVWLDTPSDHLYWVNISDLYESFEKLEDAHLMICLARLRHALEL